ncbi:MAG: hypothetical protein DSY82_07475 [Flavobacteriia bacterium]|nr:MAG: hypothetical protein DSY82_07475 [Flavobacteriia bacterium]
MEKDIREMFKEEDTKVFLPKNHRNDFKKKLMQELHEKPHSEFYFIKIAAVVLLIFSLGFFFMPGSKNDDGKEIVSAGFTLGDLSPEMKKIENYYLTAINLELTNLEVDDENRQLINNYFMKLNQLTQNYKLMNKELDPNEINEELIDRLIDNLQMRLQILIELKKELKRIKSKQNENNKI